MTARRLAIGHSAWWLREAHARLRTGDVPGAIGAWGEAKEALGRAVTLGRQPAATAGLRRLTDAFAQEVRAVLEPGPQVSLLPGRYSHFHRTPNVAQSVANPGTGKRGH